MDFDRCDDCDENTFLYPYKEKNLCNKCITESQKKFLENHDPLNDVVDDKTLQMMLNNSFSLMQMFYGRYLNMCVENKLNPLIGPHAEKFKQESVHILFNAQITSIILTMRKNVDWEGE